MVDTVQAEQPGQSDPVRGLAADEIFSDGLLGCLVFITRHFDRSIPPGALVSGLPLEEGKLTPSLFSRAAARAGLSARVVRRSLDKISSLLLPAVLLLDGDETVVLVKLAKNGAAQVIMPETGRGIATMDAEELAQRYSGYVILVKPEYQFEKADDVTSKPTGKDWFWSAVTPLWPNYIQVLIAAALINILALASPLFIMNVYDRVLPNKAIPTLWVLAIGIAIAISFDFILKMLRNSLIGNAGRRADIILASRLFAHVLNLDLSQRPMKTGEFANQLRDFENVREFFTSNTVVTLTDFVFIWLFIFIIFQISGIVAFAPMVAVLLVLIAGGVLQIPLHKAVRNAQSEATHRHSILIEALSGLETIKTTRAESQFQNKWEQFVGQNSRTTEKLRSISAWGMNFTAFAQQFVTVGVVIIGVYQFDKGEVSSGAIIAAVILAGRAVGPLGQIAGTIGRSQQAFHSLAVLNGIMSVPGEDEGGQRHIDRTISKGAVEFEKIDFSYPGAETPALRELNLKIEPGERVGIIGRIGSGKTTLGRLISRLYVPSEGSLLLDDIDVRQYHPSDIRRRVAFISQDSSLFHGSVRDNIVLGAPYVSDDLVIRAADLAGVSDFVKLHPQGFNMQVGEAGRFLSSGQRQSIALARAFLFDPLIIFLDEPSGSMDMASERALIGRLNSAFSKEQTVILTTHRTAMLALVTRLIVLENGAVIADGPRDKVLKALRDKAGLRGQESSQVEQVKNIVIPKQSAGPKIQVADFKTQASRPVRKPDGGRASGNKPKDVDPSKLKKPKSG